MPARVTTINWTSNGQFPQTISNPLSQIVTLGFDAKSGMKTSQTDPNYTSSSPSDLLVTTWQYDNFARETQENRPDGTYAAGSTTIVRVTADAYLGRMLWRFLTTSTM